MAARIILTRITTALEPLTLVEWKVKEDDRVEKGNVILVAETVGIRHDIEAEASGFLHVLVNEGNEAPIGTVAGLIAETKEELEVLRKETLAPKE